MSLVFAGEHTAFHHRHFKTVDMLIDHFENTMFGLSPYVAPCVPRTEGKFDTKEEGKGSRCTKHKRMNKILNGNDFGWKFLSKKKSSKNKEKMDDSKPCIGDDNKFSILEDIEEEDDYSVDTEASADQVLQERKIKISDTVGNLSVKDIGGIINQCNDLHQEAHESEGGRGIKIASLGVCECTSRLENEVEEKEREIEEHELQIYSVEASM